MSDLEQMLADTSDEAIADWVTHLVRGQEEFQARRAARGGNGGQTTQTYPAEVGISGETQ